MGIFNNKKNNDNKFNISYKEIVKKLSPYKSNLNDMVNELIIFEANYYKQNNNEFEEMYGENYSSKKLNEYLSSKYKNIDTDTKLNLILDDYETNYGECIYNSGCTCSNMLDKNIEVEEFKLHSKRIVIMRIKIKEKNLLNKYPKWEYYAFNYSDIDNVGDCFTKKEDVFVNNCKCYALIDAFSDCITLYKDNDKVIL